MYIHTLSMIVCILSNAIPQKGSRHDLGCSGDDAARLKFLTPGASGGPKGWMIQWMIRRDALSHGFGKFLSFIITYDHRT